MWDTDIRSEYLSNQVVQAIDSYLNRNDIKVFTELHNELKRVFPELNEGQIWNLIGLFVSVYTSKSVEKTELAITAPASFRLKSRKIYEVVESMLDGAERNITLTGYAVSDYFTEMINLIIEKSTKGVYTRLYVNDYDKQKNQLKKLMDYRSKFLRIFNYQKNADDSMAALHAKAIVVDEKQLLVSSANLSYHGMQGNIEMGIRIESQEKARQVEDLLKELVRMKTFTELRKD